MRPRSTGPWTPPHCDGKARGRCPSMEGDIYHDVDGRDETLRVFIAPARLDERFGPAAVFTIGELGFGTGLNFAVVADRFLRRSGGRLHYIAFERAPPTSDDIARAAGVSGLPLHRELSRALPPRISGWHRRCLAGGRVWLSLYFGDAPTGLADLEGRSPRAVDAWFLDGFAPPRSPAIWAPETCDAIARLSGPGTTVTTYTRRRGGPARACDGRIRGFPCRPARAPSDTPSSA